MARAARLSASACRRSRRDAPDRAPLWIRAPEKKNPDCHVLMTVRVEKNPGSDLLSHTNDRAVPSALECLTSEFGMGSGRATPVLPPETLRREIANLWIAGIASSSKSTLEASVRLLRPTLAFILPTAVNKGKKMMVKPHDRLVPVSYTGCPASTPGLSPRGLHGVFRGPKPWGDLILSLASRLDAFSGYPFRT